MSKRNCRMAAIQMVSGPRVRDNLVAAGLLVAEAVAQGAELAVLPEYFPIIGAADSDRVRAAEAFGSGPVQDWLAETAVRHGIWLVAGSIPLTASVPDSPQQRSDSCTTLSCGVPPSTAPRPSIAAAICLFGSPLFCAASIFLPTSSIFLPKSSSLPIGESLSKTTGAPPVPATPAVGLNASRKIRPALLTTMSPSGSRWTSASMSTSMSQWACGWRCLFEWASAWPGRRPGR